MRRIYKDWTIQTRTIEDDYGTGIAAVFYIDNKGFKTLLQEYRVYGEKSHKSVIGRVQQIIDNFYCNH